METYAIGDVQGCFPSLDHLITAIRFDPARHRLWFVGDLVNRGHASAAVLRFVKGLGDAAVAVLGNHDLHLLAVAAGVVPLRPKDTLQDVLQADDRDELIHWLRQRPLLYRAQGMTMVHAGLLPQWNATAAEQHARDVEHVLQSADYPLFLRALYHDRHPTRWSDDLTGLSRLAVITRAMTRLRVCAEDGTMELSFNRPPHEAPAGFFPWFRIRQRKSIETTVVFGHWAALGLHIDDHVIGLDSGCVWGRQLTALRIEDRQVFQVPCGSTPPRSFQEAKGTTSTT